jgi:branched-chain amino acid transport system permease protein
VELILQPLINGLSVGSVYAIFALGYTLVFSILGVINFAHGAIFTLGAYLTYVLIGGDFGSNGLLAGLQSAIALPFPLALLLGALLAGLVSVGVEEVAFRPLRRQGAEPLLYLVSSLGAGVVLVNLIQLLVGAESYAFPDAVLGDWPPSLVLFGVPVRTVQVLLLVVSLVMVGVLGWLLNGTRLGRALQAVSEDATTASLLGIDSDRFIRLTFFVSGALAGLAGALVGLSVSIAGPYFGIGYGLKGLGVIVLGGLGSVSGTVLGGLIVGIAEALVPADFSGYKDAVAFAFLFGMLLLRPQGLLGRKLIQKV